jgi:hypothetical protein
MGIRMACVAVYMTLVAGYAGAVNLSARETGGAGALAVFTSGAEGISSNPANLGGPSFVSVSAGAGFEGNNNTVIFKYLTGFYQQNGLIPGFSMEFERTRQEAIVHSGYERDYYGGGNWDGRMSGAGGVAVSWLGFGISYQSRSDWYVRNAPLELVQSAFGERSVLKPNTTLSVDGEIRQTDYNEMGVGYGRELLPLVPGLSLSAGGALKYLAGAKYNRFWDTGTYAIGASGADYMYANHDGSISGKGFGVDIGVAASVAGIGKAYVSCRNAYSSIAWDGIREVTKFNASTSTFLKAPAGTSFSSELPREIAAGVGAKVPVIGTNAAVGVILPGWDGDTSFRVGVEQWLGPLAIRLGYVPAVGALGSYLTGGIGLGAEKMRLDAVYHYTPDRDDSNDDKGTVGLSLYFAL